MTEIVEKNSLEEELREEEKRIGRDEKRVRNAFFITGVLLIIVLINLAVIYSSFHQARRVS